MKNFVVVVVSCYINLLKWPAFSCCSNSLEHRALWSLQPILWSCWGTSLCRINRGSHRPFFFIPWVEPRLKECYSSLSLHHHGDCSEPCSVNRDKPCYLESTNGKVRQGLDWLWFAKPGSSMPAMPARSDSTFTPTPPPPRLTSLSFPEIRSAEFFFLIHLPVTDSGRHPSPSVIVENIISLCCDEVDLGAQVPQFTWRNIVTERQQRRWSDRW